MDYTVSLSNGQWVNVYGEGLDEVYGDALGEAYFQKFGVELEDGVEIESVEPA